MGRFCDRLKILREKRGMSQQHLADELGISRSAVGNYELGSREPDFETLELIADYFNVDMDYLIGKSAIERRIPVLDWDNKNPMPIPVLQNPNLSKEAEEFLKLYETAPQEVRQTAIQVLKLGQQKP